MSRRFRKRIAAGEYRPRGRAWAQIGLFLEATSEEVKLAMVRENRRDAKSDFHVVLSLTSARALQRALQGAVDEGYRLQAERQQKRKLPSDLRQVVDEVARNLPAGNYEMTLTESGVELSDIEEGGAQ